MHLRLGVRSKHRFSYPAVSRPSYLRSDVSRSLVFYYGLQRDRQLHAFQQRPSNFQYLAQNIVQLPQQFREPSETVSAFTALPIPTSTPEPTALVGQVAKQLLQTAVHSLDVLEAKETVSADEEGYESEESRVDVSGAPQLPYSKANYEVCHVQLRRYRHAMHNASAHTLACMALCAGLAASTVPSCNGRHPEHTLQLGS